MRGLGLEPGAGFPLPGRAGFEAGALFFEAIFWRVSAMTRSAYWRGEFLVLGVASKSGLEIGQFIGRNIVSPVFALLPLLELEQMKNPEPLVTFNCR